MAAAWLLNKHADITVYEKNDYIGGHTNTQIADYNGVKIPVDTGFIVYNKVNYPNLIQLFKILGIEEKKSVMSFSVSVDDGRIEYSSLGPKGVFAQPANLFDPYFMKMLLEIVYFNIKARSILNTNEEDMPLGDFLKKLGLSDYFMRHYILPMGGAIWSCPLSTMLSYPARTFVAFFENHKLLSINPPIQWYTVPGGSIEYIKRITEPYKDKIRLNSKVHKITRQNNKAVVELENGSKDEFDHVIMATHGDQALWAIKDASPQEKEILGSFRYQRNIVVLHRDESMMPKRKSAWASWNYMGKGDVMKGASISLTYWMNMLQSIDKKYPLFTTMNPIKEIPQELVFSKVEYEHPIFDFPAIKAQEKIESIQGKNNLWFCGAYQRFGFHEDGLFSALKVVNAIGVKAPWQQ